MLHDLYNSIVLRDIVQRTGAKDVDLLKRIIEYLTQTPLQMFSAKGIAKYFESVNRKVSTETLYNYLDHIITSLIKGRKKEYYQVAYYLYDQAVIDREFGAYDNIPDNFPKYVIFMDKMDFSREGIIHKNVMDFLLWKS